MNNYFNLMALKILCAICARDMVDSCDAELLHTERNPVEESMVAAKGDKDQAR